jgi:hypothetical protein
MSRMDPKRFVEILRAVIDNSGDCDVKVRSYSGRGMYGEQCVGVDTDGGDFGYGIVAAAMIEAADDDEREALALAFSKTRTDGMGRGIIVYWPDVAWPEGEEDDDEG